MPRADNSKGWKGQGRWKDAKGLREWPEDALRRNGDEFAVGKDTGQAEKVRNRNRDVSSTAQFRERIVRWTMKASTRRRDKNMVEFAERIERYSLFGS